MILGVETFSEEPGTSIFRHLMSPDNTGRRKGQTWDSGLDLK